MTQVFSADAAWEQSGERAPLESAPQSPPPEFVVPERTDTGRPAPSSGVELERPRTRTIEAAQRAAVAGVRRARRLRAPAALPAGPRGAEGAAPPSAPPPPARRAGDPHRDRRPDRRPHRPRVRRSRRRRRHGPSMLVVDGRFLVAPGRQ